MHFRLLVLLFLFISRVGFSNDLTKVIPIYIWDNIQPDTIPVKDSTIQSKKNPLEDPIFNNARDSMVYTIDGKKVFLYGDATVNYQNIQLKAQYIEFDMGKKEVFAKGLPDSTGKIIGSPIFKDGGQSYNMDDIFYNFNSKKAKINGVVTEQDGGFLHSRVTKKMEDNTVNLADGMFTSCDQKHPHYYIAITKGKIIPNDKIISGFSYLVIEDVPTPLFLPFGFFPNTRSRASGVIIPEYGEEARRGVFLKNGGFYFGISDYIDLTLRGDIFSFGSWAVRSQSTYKQRYRYSGNVGFDISKNITNDTTSSNSYSIRWTHSQDSKASPNSSFSANVNFSSTNNNQYNAQSIVELQSNTIGSSINYSRSFVGTPFRISTSLTHSQNNLTKIVSVNFPRISLSMDKIYPFKLKSNIGAPAWYEKIGFSINTNLDNEVKVLEKNLFKPSVFDSLRNGMKHEIPLMTSFNILKYVTVSPNVNYSEFWYTNTIRKYWDSSTNKVIEDTIPGFRRAWQYNTGVSMSTKIYGNFNFGKTKAVQAIRHVLTPNISISYRPDFSEARYGFYNYYQTNINGDSAKYSIFENGIYGSPGSGKSGVISFGLGNNLEMKVRSSKDTVSNSKKIKIFENLSFNSSYNLLADSMKLNPITFSGSTKLFDKININFSGNLDPYSLDSEGKQRINKFEINSSGRLTRLTSASIGFDFSLNSPKNANSTNNQPPAGDLSDANPNGPAFGQSMGTNFSNPQRVDFSIPWDLRVSYNFSYSKALREKVTSQTLSFSGELSITPKWKIGFTSGYDFKSKTLTTTSLNINRDLHCWEMRMTIIPIGRYKSYSFQINVKSGMLKDLKWSKRDSYLDN